MSTLKGRVALVGGGEPELSAAVRTALADAGASVVAWTDAAGVDFGDAAFAADPAQPDALNAAVSRLHARGVDVFVSLPCWAPNAPFAAYPLDAWAEALARGLSGPAVLARALLPAMTRRRFGRIVLVATDAADGADAGEAARASAEAGLLALARVIAANCRVRGVACAAVTAERPVAEAEVARCVADLCIRPENGALRRVRSRTIELH